MKKTKQYYMRMAIIKTIVSGLIYLCMPIIAGQYHKLIGNEAFENYVGYIAAAGFLFIAGSLILLVMAWAQNIFMEKSRVMIVAVRDCVRKLSTYF